jgi:carboxypeptidase Taq
VHGKASRFSTAEIITQATGKPLDPAVFEGHLRVRYING